MEFGFDDYMIGKVIALNKAGTVKGALRKKKQAEKKLVKADDVKKQMEKYDTSTEEARIATLKQLISEISITDKYRAEERLRYKAELNDLEKSIVKKKAKIEKLQKKYDKLKEQYEEDTTYSSTNPDPEKEYVTITKNTKLKIWITTLMVPSPEGEEDTSLCLNPEWTESSRDIVWDQKGFSSVTIPMADSIISNKIAGKKRIKIKSKDTVVKTQEFVTAKTNLNSSKTDSADATEEIMVQLKRQIDDDVQKIKKKKVKFYVELNSMIQCKCIGGKLNKWAYYIPEESIEEEEEYDEEYDEYEEEDFDDYDMEDEDNEAVLQQYLNSRERGDYSGANKFYD